MVVIRPKRILLSRTLTRLRRQRRLLRDNGEVTEREGDLIAKLSLNIAPDTKLVPLSTSRSAKVAEFDDLNRRIWRSIDLNTGKLAVKVGDRRWLTIRKRDHRQNQNQRQHAYCKVAHALLLLFLRDFCLSRFATGASRPRPLFCHTDTFQKIRGFN